MRRREFIYGAVAAAGAVAGCVRAGAKKSRLTVALPALDAAKYHASRRLVTTPFGRIAYVERGNGPVALFLHGLPLNGFQWRGALERLATLRRCIAPDFMGMGYSEVPDAQDLSPESQRDMLASVLDAMSVGAVDLVANDSGGAVAQLFVARYPARVRTLLLTNCDVHADSPPRDMLAVIARAHAGTFVDEVLRPQVVDKAAVRSASGLATCCYSTPGHPADEAVDYYLRPLISSQQRTAQFHRLCVAMERNPLLAIEPLLRRSEVPVRVVWGMADTIFRRESADWLDQTFPRSRGVRRLGGAKLFFPEEMPEVIAEEARQLWKGA